MHIIFWSENFKGKNHSENLGIDGEIILEWIWWKYGTCVWCGVDSFGSG